MQSHTLQLNPEPAEFLKWTRQFSIFGTVHYQFCGYRNCSWSANSIEPDQIAWMFRLAWLFAGDNLLWIVTFVSSRVKVKLNIFSHYFLKTNAKRNFQIQLAIIITKKRRYIALHMSVGRYVGRSIGP